MRGRLAKRRRGAVLVATDEPTGRTVCIKTGQGLSDQVWVEADFYSRLRGCPGIPNIVWDGIDDREGEDVSAALAIDVVGVPLARFRHRATRKELLRFAECLTRTLHALHQRGVIHRDIKPNNVVVSDGRPYLIDFGCATTVEDGSDSFAGSSVCL